MTRADTEIEVERIDRHRNRVLDHVVIEEPMEIRLNGAPLVVTMRTPGDDIELAAGFLYTERLIAEADDIESIGHCASTEKSPSGCNIVEVKTAEHVAVDLSNAQRNFFASSSCGLCGKTSIKQVHARVTPVVDGFRTTVDILRRLSEQLRLAQTVFDQTGGLHAAGLFDAGGHLICAREDIGRHNAVDKVIGWALLNDVLPLSNHILLVSGRASFEIVQKSLAPSIPVVAAISAGSSLAVELARASNQTLIGFLRGASMTVYCGGGRLVDAD